MLGAGVDLVRPEEVMHHVETAVAERRPFLVANHNAHSLYLIRRRPELKAFFDAADVVEVDSAPVIAFTRLLGLHSRPFHRCTYLDWRDHFWSLAARNGWRVFYLGGAPGVAAEAARRLGERYPGVRVETQDGYFDMTPGAEEATEALARIASFDPHVLFVGMGMPRQELWIAQNRAALPPCAVFSVGAAFDYEAGAQRAAPRWMGRLGVEWLFRLCVDPRRLAHRYCVEPWFLVPSAIEDVAQALREGRLFRRPRSSPAGGARV